MRTAGILSLLLVLQSGCASIASSVTRQASRRYQRLCTSHRFTEAAFEYEYACANRELSDELHSIPETSSDVLLRNAPVWLDMEPLIAWAEDKNLRLAGPAHDRLALLLDKPGSLSSAELGKYYRDNRSRLWYKGPHFVLMPENSITASASAGGSAGGIRGDDPLSIARASYKRFLQLCRERRYREAAVEYQYGLRNYRYVCAAIGAPPTGAGSFDPLLRPLRKPGNLDRLVEIARHVKDYADLEGPLRLCLKRSQPHLDAPGLTLAQMIKSLANRK